MAIDSACNPMKKIMELHYNPMPPSDGLHELQVFEHPVLPQKVVKKGMAWPGIVFGPGLFLYKKLWPWAAVAIGAGAVIAFFKVNVLGPMVEESSDDFYRLFHAWFDFFALLGINLYVVESCNEHWARDLENRGYVITRSIRARSMDDLRAILARESSKDQPATVPQGVSSGHGRDHTR